MPWTLSSPQSQPDVMGCIRVSYLTVIIQADGGHRQLLILFLVKGEVKTPPGQPRQLCSDSFFVNDIELLDL